MKNRSCAESVKKVAGSGIVWLAGSSTGILPTLQRSSAMISFSGAFSNDCVISRVYTIVRLGNAMTQVRERCRRSGLAEVTKPLRPVTLQVHDSTDQNSDG